MIGIKKLYSKSLMNRKYVSPNGTGDFTTIKDAVDYFNNSATEHTEILISAGVHDVADTITVNNATYSLFIRGTGSGTTILQSAAGLVNKPMFDIRSNCDITKIGVDGSALANWGDLDGENFITYSTTEGFYSEITDVIMDTANIGIEDTVGIDLFLFNFVISTCTVAGVRIAHSSLATCSTDIETGNFESCIIGVDLVSATSDSFTIINCFFVQDNPTDIGIKYDGDNYGYNGLASIKGCEFNGTGIFYSGFDFHRLDGRDADIEVFGNTGLENKKPHVKLNVVDNTTTTTVATAGTFVKLNGIKSTSKILLDLAATSGTFTITIGDQTTGNIAYDADIAAIKAALEATSLTTVTVTQVVASKEWNITFDTAGEGWDWTQTVDVSALGTTTSGEIIKSFYVCKITPDIGKVTYQPDFGLDGVSYVSGNIQVNQNNRNVTVGILKNNTGNIVSPMTVRCAVQNQPYPFSLIGYLDDVAKNDYYELFVTSSSDGDVVMLQDLTWYSEGR